MSLIEGVGDEVTAFFVIILLLLVICLAWVSTNIRDIPFFSVIIVELTNGRRRVHTGNPTALAEEVANEANTEQNPTQQERSSVETPDGESEQSPQNLQAESQDSREETSNAGIGGENEPQASENTPNSSPSQNVESESGDLAEDTDSDSNLTETELRRRRLDFFQKQASPELRQSSSESVGVSASVEANSKSAKSLSVEKSCKNRDDCSQPIEVPENRSRTDVIQSESRISNQSGTIRSDSSSDQLTSDNSRADNSGPGGRSESVGDGGNSSVDSQINIRLKYLNDTQRSVIASPLDTIGQFRRANFAAELSENKLVRFIFNGQDLRNDANTLQAYNVVDNSVIHCLITNDNRNNATPMMHQDNGFDIGLLMLPLFGFMICLVWYLRFEYRQFFTATSTMSLIGVTFLFIAAVLASWEGHRRGHAHREHVE